MHPPPPPPPPQAAPIPSPIHPPPVVSPTGPPNAFLVELITFNGAPFKDHWAYWIHSPDSPDLGVQIHAAGDVYNGFKREARRSLDFRTAIPVPTKRTPLQWVDGRFFDERAMLNAGSFCDHYAPVTHFEISAWMVKPPGKTLNAVDDVIWLLFPFLCPFSSAGF